MATIPQLERRTVNPQTRVASVDLRGAASLGEQVGAGITKVKDTRDRYQLADATSKFSIMKHQQDNAIGADDEEYHTYVDRYSKNMEEGLGEIAAGISDPQLRNAFTMENKPRVVAGQEQMRKKAFAVETDVQKSNLNSRLDGLSKSILDTGTDQADKLLSIENAVDQIDAARESGYISSETAGNLERAFKADTAVKFVNALPIEEQKDALNSKLAKDNIPADVHAKMLRALGPKLDEEKGREFADKYSGKSMREQNAALRELPHAVRSYAERFVDYDNARIKQAQLSEDEAFHQKDYMRVVTGEITLDDMTGKGDQEYFTSFKALPTKFQDHMMRAASARLTSKSRTASDIVVIDKLYRLNAEGNAGDPKAFEKLRAHYLANLDKLSSKDLDTWSRVSNEGIIDEAYKSKFTLIQRVDNKLAAKKIFDPKKSLLVRNLVDQWYEKEFDDGHPNPDEKKTNEFIDRAIASVFVGDKSFTQLADTRPTEESYFNEEKAWYETTPEEQLTVRADVLDNPDKASKAQLNIVLDIAFAQNESQQEWQLAVDAGTLRYNDLQPAIQERLRDEIRDNDPKWFDMVTEDFIKRYKREPSHLEAIQGYNNVVANDNGSN